MVTTRPWPHLRQPAAAASGLKSPKILRDPRSEVLGSKVDLGSFSKNFTYEINKTDMHVLEGFRPEYELD